MRKKTLIYFSAIMILVGSGLSSKVYADPANVLTIMHTNDMHGRIEPAGSYNIARLKTMKDTLQPNLMLDAGDAFQGLPISNSTKGSQMAGIMNEIGYDAMTLGNHEFDFGKDIALGYKTLLNFPIISSNIINRADQSKPYEGIIKYKEPNTGKDVVVMGITTPETAFKTHPNNVSDIYFEEPIDTVKQEIANNEADVYVIMAHLGIDLETPFVWRSTGLADALANDPDLSDKMFVIIDGHSHTELPEGIKVGDNVIIAQTGTALAYVGYVEIDLDDFTNSKASLLTLDSYEPDPIVATLMDNAYNDFEESVSEVIYQGNTVELNGIRNFVRTQETNLGNLVSDALWNYGQDGFSNPTDFSVVNGGGLRTSIASGDITIKDIIAVLPFGNTLTQIEVTGQQVWDMFEYSVGSDIVTESWNAVQNDDSKLPLLNDYGYPTLTPKGGFLHVSDSIRVYYDSNLKYGNRITAIEILNRNTGKFENIDLNKKYYMATNDFLAVGGDGYTMLGGAREEGPSLDDVVVNFIKSDNINWETYKTTKPVRIITMDKESYNRMKIDLDPYTNTIKQANELINSHKYTEESVEVLKSAIVALEDEINSDKYTKESLDALHNKLLEAIDNLVEKKEQTESDKPITETPKDNDGDKGKELPKTGIKDNSLYVYALLLVGIILVIKRNKNSKI